MKDEATAAEFAARVYLDADDFAAALPIFLRAGELEESSGDPRRRVRGGALVLTCGRCPRIPRTALPPGRERG
ncbi:hypothetical protein [Actinomadura rubteroloni]|uniref:hypothetical protein n=1 Tax=Actinomadura rubteroloni TaxID=1926885 RepID=UPI000CD86C2A|nr:hypothetical protein [Actinomadura rubteroloni]